MWRVDLDGLDAYGPSVETVRADLVRGGTECGDEDVTVGQKRRLRILPRSIGS